MTFSRDKKKALLARLFWDRKPDIEYVLELLDGGPERFAGDRINLYCRLLSTYGWYTLLKLIPNDRLRDEALSDAVIARLFPGELKKKYEYARRALSEQTGSSPG